MRPKDYTQLINSMLTIALFGLLIGIVVLWYAHRRQRGSGLPVGRVIYTDTRDWEQLEAPLYDPDARLTGRPDYLVKNGNQVIPVEVKSSRVSNFPYDSHLYQLMAYCLLVESTFGVRPDHGILHYPNKTFEIKYTRAIEAELRIIMKEIRSLDRRKEVQRSHDHSARCRGCGYGFLCDQRLS